MADATPVGTSDPSASRAGYQVFRILQVAFVAAPVVAGIDKFFNVLVQWDQYLAPFFGDVVGASTFMALVGVIEIAAGIGVALKPRIFAHVVSAWLVAIIFNLLLLGDYYDVALRDLGLALAALALGRLSTLYEKR